jgi:hypothetical protein
MNLFRKGVSVALMAIMMTVICLPAPVMAGDRYYDDYYGGSSNFGKGIEKGGGEVGRSLGGATGMAIGAIGGAAIASAVVKAAGIAALGPLATALTISAITAGSLFLGSKVFSTLGQSLERSMGSKNLWTMLGAAGGAVAAIALLGSAGIFAGPAGLLFKALIGGVVGGSLARLFSGALETIATPRILYAAVGGLVAAVGGMGFAGAIGGVAFGFLLGSIMDSVYFADRNRTLGGYVNQGKGTVGGIMDKFRGWTSNIKNWLSGKTNGVGNWAERNWDRDSSNSHYNDYYDQGYNYGYGNQYDGYGQTNYKVDYTRGYQGNQDYGQRYDSYRDDYQEFLRLNNDPNASIEARRRALENVRRSNVNLHDYGSSFSGSFNYNY